MYFYHPDHLGSSSYITDREGRITQHTEYIAFGEVLFEEHSTSKTMPYLFNGKEFLKQSTGLKITIIERAVNKNMEQKQDKQKQDKQNNNTK